MHVERLAIPDVFLVTPKRFGDARGWFAETFVAKRLEEHTGPISWVQDNQSFSARRGTLRALHFQIPPFAQDKLVSCLRGRVLDIAVDIRRGSPTFGQHVVAELSAEDGAQIFVPKGFAHGFIALEDNCEIAYKVSAYYDKASERGLDWADSALGIDWRVPSNQIVAVDRDLNHPKLAALEAYF